MKGKLLSRLSLGCRIILGLLFIVLSIPKVMDPHDFALAISRYRICPYVLINITAICLPWVEGLAGAVLLFSRKWRDAAALILIAMLGLFAVIMVSVIQRGLEIDCGCLSFDLPLMKLFGRVSWLTVSRNIVLMLMGLVVFIESWHARLQRNN